MRNGIRPLEEQNFKAHIQQDKPETEDIFWQDIAKPMV